MVRFLICSSFILINIIFLEFLKYIMIKYFFPFLDKIFKRNTSWKTLNNVSDAKKKRV